MSSLLEIACFNHQSAIVAAKNGAHRVELCRGYEVGGTTPGNEEVLTVLQSIAIPVHCMVRARGGNFIYSKSELSAMARSAEWFSTRGVKGIVSGILTTYNEVDVSACRSLVKAAGNMIKVFHRAFDEISDKEKACEEIIDLGFNCILTSGGGGSATDGLIEILRLQKKYGEHIIFIAGGGIRSSNVHLFLQAGITNLHSSALVQNQTIADQTEIADMKKVVDQFV